MFIIKGFVSGIMAGILISLGGSVFLSCDNRYVGAVLFSVALLCICYKGYALFTGKVGYIPESHTKNDIKLLFSCLAGNLISTALIGALLGNIIPSYQETAYRICTLKLEQTYLQTLVRAVFCGILMYLAVSTYREKQSIFGILFCVPAFILSGFEHSIANMFYFGASGIYCLDSVIYILLVIIGNSFGGIVLPLLTKIGKE